MKKVVSVSLGSSSRDHRVEKVFLDEKFVIERLGTDGDLNKTRLLFEELDGKVDAIGMGGISLYVTAGEKKYYFRQAKKLIKNVKQTPVVDGGGIKDILERRGVEYINELLDGKINQKKVLVVCAVDRFGMAQAFADFNSSIVFGDLIYAVGLPIPIRTIKGLKRALKIMAPVMVNLPFKMLYPVGKAQDKDPSNRKSPYFQEADIIGGDFHYIKKYRPADLKDKIILTNTVTKKDMQDLKKCGVSKLITTSPQLAGRSFGSNVIEAVLAAYLQKGLQKITTAEYEKGIDELGLKPALTDFNQEEKYENS